MTAPELRAWIDSLTQDIDSRKIRVDLPVSS